MRKAKAASEVLVELADSNPELVEKLFSKWTVTGSEETLQSINVTGKKTRTEKTEQKNRKKKNIEKTFPWKLENIVDN